MYLNKETSCDAGDAMGAQIEALLLAGAFFGVTLKICFVVVAQHC